MLEADSRAPDFTLDDYTGTTRNLSSALSEGPSVLAFLKADCAVCQLAFPYLERLRQTYPGPDWQIWGISQHQARAAEAFAKRNGVTFPILIDAEGLPVSNAYDPPATPTIFLVGQDGTIQSVHSGLSKNELNALAGRIARMVGQEPVVIAPPDDGKPSFRPG